MPQQPMQKKEEGRGKFMGIEIPSLDTLKGRLGEAGLRLTTKRGMKGLRATFVAGLRTTKAFEEGTIKQVEAFLESTMGQGIFLAVMSVTAGSKLITNQLPLPEEIRKFIREEVAPELQVQAMENGLETVVDLILPVLQEFSQSLLAFGATTFFRPSASELPEGSGASSATEEAREPAMAGN